MHSVHRCADSFAQFIRFILSVHNGSFTQLSPGSDSFVRFTLVHLLDSCSSVHSLYLLCLPIIHRFFFGYTSPVLLCLLFIFAYYSSPLLLLPILVFAYYSPTVCYYQKNECVGNWWMNCLLLCIRLLAPCSLLLVFAGLSWVLGWLCSLRWQRRRYSERIGSVMMALNS